MATKHNVLEAHLKEWLTAKKDKKRRGEIVKFVSSAIQIHPKSVPRAFQRLQKREDGGKIKRGRPRIYGNEVQLALKEVWEAANRCCGELLHPIIPDYVRALQCHGEWTHTEATTTQLLAMSLGTVKRRTLGLQKKHGVRRGISSTKPSSLKSLVPVFSGPWKDLPPGYGQTDTVAHCGDTLLGDFAFTVNYTDATTYWTIPRAQWNKGQRATLKSIEVIRERLPFVLLGLHPDSGGEFVNKILYAWCKEEGIGFSRSRPGKKNDNMYVEERNGHVVRKHLGWLRFDCEEIVPLMNEFYDLLTLYLNHFQAVRRQVSRERIGSKYRRTYETKAKTPYARVLERNDIPEETKQRLRKEHETLNPLQLKRQLDMLRAKIYKTQKAAREER